MTLNTLRVEDIDEKIRLNENAGIDIYALREDIKKQLNDFTWVSLRAQVQCQSYREQLDHINKRISDIEKEK